MQGSRWIEGVRAPVPPGAGARAGHGPHGAAHRSIK